MELSKYIGNKVHQKVEDYKEERKFRNEVKAEAKQEFRKGYREGKIKTAYERGKGVQSGKHTQHVTGRVGAVAKGVSSGLEGFGDTFLGKGGGFGGGGLGDGFGGGGFFGGEEGPKRQAPQRITTVSRSGTVRITEPVQREHREEAGEENFWMGGAAGTSKKGNRERHPLEW